MHGCNCTQHSGKKVRDPLFFLYVSPRIKLFDVQKIFKRKSSGGFSGMRAGWQTSLPPSTVKTMKMTWKNPKTDTLFLYNSPLLILTKKWGETFHFLLFKDEKQHFRVLTLTPIIPEEIPCSNFFCHLCMPRSVLYSISKFEQNAWGSLTPLVPP